MMISRGQGRLLLPIRPGFVILSLSVATVLQIALLFIAGRDGAWMPNFLLLTYSPKNNPQPTANIS